MLSATALKRGVMTTSTGNELLVEFYTSIIALGILYGSPSFNIAHRLCHKSSLLSRRHHFVKALKNDKMTSGVETERSGVRFMKRRRPFFLTPTTKSHNCWD